MDAASSTRSAVKGHLLPRQGLFVHPSTGPSSNGTLFEQVHPFFSRATPSGDPNVPSPLWRALARPRRCSSIGPIASTIRSRTSTSFSWVGTSAIYNMLAVRQRLSFSTPAATAANVQWNGFTCDNEYFGRRSDRAPAPGESAAGPPSPPPRPAAAADDGAEWVLEWRVVAAAAVFPPAAFPPPPAGSAPNRPPRRC